MGRGGVEEFESYEVETPNYGMHHFCPWSWFPCSERLLGWSPWIARSRNCITTPWANMEVVDGNS